MSLGECWECKRMNLDWDDLTTSDHYWEYTNSRMSSYQKSLPKSWSKIADASRKITNQTSLSILSSLSTKSNHAYKIFNSPEDEFTFSKNSLEKFKAEDKTAQSNNKIILFLNRCGEALYDLYSSDSLQTAVTALYAKLLIILGLALPLSEVISASIDPEYFQLFYVYLFTGSLLYLLFVYIDLLQERAKCILVNKPKNISIERNEAPARKVKVLNRKTSFNLLHRPGVHYGSYYLRIGTLLFGIGSLIYTGIEIGDNFEARFMNSSQDCENTDSVVRSSLQLVFIFFQMYFIFLNQKMNIYKRRFLSRLGLMHMIATNICVWLKVVILETKHEIEITHLRNGEDIMESHTDQLTTSSDYGGTISMPGVDQHFIHTGDIDTIDILHATEKHNCQRNEIVHNLLESSGPFLFPCTIEFSLICAAVLFIMWKNVSTEHEYYKLARLRNMHSRVESDISSGDQRYSVDCSRASTGLFCGIVVMVVTIISLIMFFVFITNEDASLRQTAVQVASYSELIMYGLTSVAVIIGMCQMRKLWYDDSRTLELDNLLLIIAQTGVFMYAAFSIIGTFFQLEDHLPAFLASLLTLIQTTLQTVFILDASCRFACTSTHAYQKPGRQMVTFLLVCNLAMWMINTLETSRADAHPIQVQFYGGGWAWPMISHIAMPLAIFYRFHSTVCLFEIWKKSFKQKYVDTNSV